MLPRKVSKFKIKLYKTLNCKPENENFRTVVSGHIKPTRDKIFEKIGVTIFLPTCRPMDVQTNRVSSVATIAGILLLLVTLLQISSGKQGDVTNIRSKILPPPRGRATIPPLAALNPEAVEEVHELVAAVQGGDILRGTFSCGLLRFAFFCMICTKLCFASFGIRTLARSQFQACQDRVCVHGHVRDSSGWFMRSEMQLSLCGYFLFLCCAGYYTDPNACPSQRYPILDIQHNTDPTHGDVCRNAMPHWAGWTCPTGCFAANPSTKAPYCLNDYNEVCRAKVPVVCKGGGFGCNVINIAKQTALEWGVAEFEGVTATDLSATAKDTSKGASRGCAGVCVLF